MLVASTCMALVGLGRYILELDALRQRITDLERSHYDLSCKLVFEVKVEKYCGVERALKFGGAAV